MTGVRVTDNRIVNVRGVGSAAAFGTPNIRMRTYFSLHHIGAAAHFARLSKKVETEYSGTIEEEQFKQHRTYVTGSIVMAISFLEATINELFSDAQEGEAEQIRQLQSDTVSLLANMWGLPKTESFSILRVPGITISPSGRRKQTISPFVTPGDRPAWASFVGEHQKRGLAVEPPNDLFNVGLPAPDRSHEHRRIGAVRLGVRDADKVLVDVQADEKGSRLGHG
jgi:hypothetical protein